MTAVKTLPNIRGCPYAAAVTPVVFGQQVGAESECAPGSAGPNRICTISDKPKTMGCFGDSGGPQMQNGRNQKWELIGVTSGPGIQHGTPCSQSPGLYTNAPAYAAWIQTTMKTNKAPAEDGTAPAKTGAHNTALLIADASSLTLASSGTIITMRHRKTRRTS